MEGYLRIPELGQIQLCYVSLNEGGIAMVTIVLPVLLNKAFHKVHSRHVSSHGQQAAGETTVEGTGQFSIERQLICAHKI